MGTEESSFCIAAEKNEICFATNTIKFSCLWLYCRRLCSESAIKTSPVSLTKSTAEYGLIVGGQQDGIAFNENSLLFNMAHPLPVTIG